MFQDIKNKFETIIIIKTSYKKEKKIGVLKKLKKMEISTGKMHNNVEHLPEILNQIKVNDFIGNIRILDNSF